MSSLIRFFLSSLFLRNPLECPSCLLSLLHWTVSFLFQRRIRFLFYSIFFSLVSSSKFLLSLSLLVHRPLILFVSISSGFTFPSLASSSFPLAFRRDSSKERSEERERENHRQRDKVRDDFASPLILFLPTFLSMSFFLFFPFDSCWTERGLIYSTQHFFFVYHPIDLAGND